MPRSFLTQSFNIDCDTEDEASTSTPVVVREGDIMKAKPKFFEPRPHGSANIGQHPVIVLTNPDSQGRVKVATMSHSHPHDPPTRPASKYGLPIDPKKGESTVSVGRPHVIHVSRLKSNNPHISMSPKHFQALRGEIKKNCSDAVYGRDPLYHF